MSLPLNSFPCNLVYRNLGNPSKPLNFVHLVYMCTCIHPCRHTWRLEETPREGNIKTLSSTVSLISKTVPVTESVAHLWVVGQSSSPTEQQPHRFACLRPARAEVVNAGTAGFYMDAGDPHTGPHTCTARLYPEPAPETIPTCVIFLPRPSVTSCYLLVQSLKLLLHP